MQVKLTPLARRGDTQACEELFETMRGAGLVNAATYATLMNAYAQCGDLKGAEGVFQRMASDGITPKGGIIFATMINACALKRDPSAAVTWFQRLQRVTNPKVEDYNAIINAYASALKSREAEMWFEHLVADGLEPSPISYRTLIKAHSYVGDVDAVERWLDRMAGDGVELNDLACGLAVKACVPSANVSRAEGFLQRLVAVGLEPSKILITQMINVAAHAGDVGKVQQYFEAAQKRDSPDSNMYDHALRACGRASPKDAEYAEKIFRQMARHAGWDTTVRPNRITINELAFAVGRARMVELCRELDMDPHQAEDNGPSTRMDYMAGLARTNEEKRQPGRRPR